MGMAKFPQLSRAGHGASGLGREQLDGNSEVTTKDGVFD